MTLDEALEALQRVVIRSEADLSILMDNLLTKNQIAHSREVFLSDTDRIDFVVGRVGVELKTKGAANAIVRQLSRYAQSASLDSLVLVTTRHQHTRGMPRELSGKPVRVILVGAWL